MPEWLKQNWKILLVWLWIVFTLSLALWWTAYSMNLVESLSYGTQLSAQEVQRQKTMLKWEALTWLILLLVGGLSLARFVWRERQRIQSFKDFMAAFSHDLKTSLTSVRLQAESLQEDFPTNQNIPRLVADTVRLQLQLENSLLVAQGDQARPYMEELLMSKLIGRIELQWPQIKVNLQQDCTLNGDERALESVIKNIVHNAVVHGEADRLDIQCKSGPTRQICIEFSDNGKGYRGDVERLGKPFAKPTGGGGSGVGLYLADRLIKKMGGELSFDVSDGFRIHLLLPGKLQ